MTSQFLLRFCGTSRRITRLLASAIAVALFCLMANSAHALWISWNAPSSVASGDDYYVEAHADWSYYGADVTVFKRTTNTWFAGGTDVAGAWTYDSGTQTVVYYAEAYDWYTGETVSSSISVQITSSSNVPPEPVITVGSFERDQTVIRPNGGARQIAVTFSASDTDGNLAGIRPNVWHPATGYFYNNGGAMVPVYEHSGQVTQTVTLDRDGDWYFWTDAIDGADAYSSTGDWGNGFHIVVTEAAATPPVATVAVSGFVSGSTATRQRGAPIQVTIRFRATDEDGNLTGIRPQIWHPDSGYFWSNGGAFVTQSGDSGEVVQTFSLPHNGDWYFWTDAIDANNQFVNSGAWGDGFKLTVAENAAPTGNSEWMDVNGDGLLDEVIRPNTARFGYSIDSWWTYCEDWWWYPVNDVFSLWDILWPWGEYGDDFEWIWYPELFWYYGSCYTYVEPALVFDTEAGYDYHVFQDRSGSSSVNPGNWSEVLSGAFGSGTQHISLGTLLADEFYMDQFYLVRYAVAPNGVAVTGPAGTVLGTVVNGATIKVPLPPLGTLEINPIDALGSVLGLGQATWSITRNGTPIIINGQPVVDLTLFGAVDIGVFGPGSYGICVRLSDSTQLCITVTVVQPSIELVKYPYDSSTQSGVTAFKTARNAGTLQPANLVNVLPERTDVPRLRVAKWMDAFGGFWGGVRDDFVKQDVDQFFVRVTDHSKDGKGQLPVGIYTSQNGGTLDGITQLVLTEIPANSGTFLSVPLLLVSDDFDANANTMKIPRGSTNHQTHLVKVGTAVHATYPDTGDLIAETSRPVPVEHRVDVEIVIFKDRPGGRPLIDIAKVQDQWRAVEERYAQVGIKVYWTIRGNTAYDPPAGYNASNEVLCYTNTSLPPQHTGTLSNDLRAIVDLNGTVGNTSDIQVFYVGKMKPWNDPSLQLKAIGFSAMPVNLDPGSSGYGNNAFIDATNVHLYTAAHELGHLLLNGEAQTGPQDAHHHNGHNLMFKTESDNRDIAGTKRLDAFEEERMAANTTLVHVP